MRAKRHETGNVNMAKRASKNGICTSENLRKTMKPDANIITSNLSIKNIIVI